MGWKTDLDFRCEEEEGHKGNMGFCQDKYARTKLMAFQEEVVEYFLLMFFFFFLRVK